MIKIVTGRTRGAPKGNQFARKRPGQHVNRVAIFGNQWPAEEGLAIRAKLKEEGVTQAQKMREWVSVWLQKQE